MGTQSSQAKPPPVLGENLFIGGGLVRGGRSGREQTKVLRKCVKLVFVVNASFPFNYV